MQYSATVKNANVSLIYTDNGTVHVLSKIVNVGSLARMRYILFMSVAKHGFFGGYSVAQCVDEKLDEMWHFRPLCIVSST